MALPLPVELTGLAAGLDLTWPEADEDALHAAAQPWIGLAEALRAAAAGSAAEVGRLLASHAGGNLDGFGARWAGGPATRLADAALAAEALAAGLTTMAAVVLELKAFAIGQLAALAAQLAAQPAVPDPAAGPLAGSLAASLGAQATAVAATRVALQRAWAGAAAVVEGAVVPLLRSAEARLRVSQAVPWPARPSPRQPTP